MLIGRPRTNDAQTQHPALGAVNQPVAAVRRRTSMGLFCYLGLQITALIACDELPDGRS